MLKPKAATTRSTVRTRRQALAAIAIPLIGTHLRAYRRWAERAATIDVPVRDLLRFASWYEPAIDEWIEAATNAGLWHSSTERPWEGPRDCRAEDPDAVLTHLRDVDGTQIHVRIVDDGRRAALHADFCRMAVSDSAVERIWTDQQRLTYEELLAGVTCRSCGRPLLSHRREGAQPATLDQDAIKETNEAFLARHANCGALRWSIAGEEIVHCSRCCAPPPLAPATVSQIAKILGSILADEQLRESPLSTRWAKSARATGSFAE